MDSTGFAATSAGSDDPRLRDLTHRLQRTLPDAHLDLVRLDTPQPLRLALINADYQTGPLPPEVMHAVVARPAYWAFCWGSGLATAQLLLEQPGHVAGRSVLDFGSGSGVAGIAAALAGAAEVTAVDIDADACAATACNAALNQVDLEICEVLDDQRHFDLILLADVLYDRSNLPLLAALRERCRTLLVADSRFTNLDQQLPAALDARRLGSREAITQPNLGEFDEFREVVFFGFGASAGPGRLF
ncbi:MAG: 50S ribosomal protein L11 methyltransferase [Pseudomonadota bacterium]